MKKLCGFWLGISLLGAVAADSIPASIWLTGGEVSVRLDAAKRHNMNRIEWRGKYFCVDVPGSHYGTVFSFRDKKGFAGSGHRETGHVEHTQSLKIFCDGKEVAPDKANGMAGKHIRVERKSTIRNFQLESVVEVSGNRIDETLKVYSPTAADLRVCYLFMHPWTTRFLDLYAVTGKKQEKNIRFGDSEKNVIEEPAEFAAWRDPNNGDCVVTVCRAVSGAKNFSRRIWDRSCYRKDYNCDYTNSVFPAEHTAVYRAQTVFFNQPDENLWREEARAAAEKFKW